MTVLGCHRLYSVGNPATAFYLTEVGGALGKGNCCDVIAYASVSDYHKNALISIYWIKQSPHFKYPHACILRDVHTINSHWDIQIIYLKFTYEFIWANVLDIKIPCVSIGERWKNDMFISILWFNWFHKACRRIADMYPLQLLKVICFPPTTWCRA